jgi:hypothetical protein
MQELSEVCICGAIRVLKMENIVVVVVVAFVVVGHTVPPFDSGVTGRRHVPMTDYSTFSVLLLATIRVTEERVTRKPTL